MTTIRGRLLTMLMIGLLVYGVGIGALIYRYWYRQARTIRWVDGVLLTSGLLLIQRRR